jgi:hypothetical protein
MSDKSVGVYDASPARRRSQKYPVAAEKQHRKVMTEEAMRHDRPRLRGRGTHQEASDLATVSACSRSSRLICRHVPPLDHPYRGWAHDLAALASPAASEVSFVDSHRC